MILGFLFVAASLAAVPDRLELDDLRKREHSLNEKLRALAEKKRNAEMTGATGEDMRLIMEEEQELRQQRDKLRDERHELFEHNRRKMPHFGRNRRLEEFRKAADRRVPPGAKLLQDSEASENQNVMENKRDEMLRRHHQKARAESVRNTEGESKKSRITDLDWKTRKSEIMRRIEELRQQKREDEETEEDIVDRDRDEVDVEIEALEAELFAGKREWDRKVEEQREVEQKEMERERRRKEMGDDAQPAEERAKKLDSDKNDVNEEMRKQAEQRKLKMQAEQEKMRQDSNTEKISRNGAPPLSVGKIILIGGVVLVVGFGGSMLVRRAKAKKFRHKKNELYDQADSGTNGWP